MKFKSLVNFCIILFFITGILQISSIRSFAQSSTPLGIPVPTYEIGPYEIGGGLSTASGVIVYQSVDLGCGFVPNSPTTVCGVSTKGENYWLGIASHAGFLQHSFSTIVNYIEYNITGLNLGEVITVTVSNGTPSISVITGCDYSVNGNILSGTKLSGDTGVKIRISSNQPYSWVRLSHGGGGSGCNVTLDGNSVLAATASVASVPFSKWATMIGFSLIFLLTAVRFKRFF